MYHLTPAQMTMVNNSFMWTIVLAVMVFGVLGLVMILLFGLSTKEAFKNTKGIFALALISLITPLLFSQLNRQKTISSQAAVNIKVVKIEVAKINETSFMVDLQLSEPAAVYLEYKDENKENPTVIWSNHSLEKDNLHTFLVKDAGQNGGEANLVVNGQRVLLNNKKIEFK